MSAPARPNFWKPLVIAAALAFVYASVLVKLGYDWWTDENYSHGLLIPFIIGYLLWIERDRFRRLPHRASTLWGAAAIACALLMLWAGTAGAELYIQRLSLALMLAGIVVYFWGFRVLRYAFVPFLLLFLALPIPTIVFNKIAFPLQLFASRCAVWAMGLFDIPVLRQGNVIELMPLGARETKKLEVVEACSGIRSLMTLVTLAVVFAYFTYPTDGDVERDGNGGEAANWKRALRRYGFWRSVLLVLAAIPVAILTNALRVSGTGVLARYYGTRVADGFFHSFSGWVIYIVAFLLIFGIGWLLDRFGRIGSGKSGGSSRGSGRAENSATGKTKDETVNVSGSSPVAGRAEIVSVKGAE
jgi:exosortase